jgi:hypothetical protein
LRLGPEKTIEILLDHFNFFALIAGANPNGEYCRNPAAKSTELFGMRSEVGKNRRRRRRIKTAGVNETNFARHGSRI